MKRTVSKMGNSSLVISLPHHWVKEQNIQKGDELNVEPIEKGLIVSLTQLRQKEKVLNIDVSSYSQRTTLNLLNYAYRNGYLRMNIKFKDEKQLQYITKTVRNKLLGFEVVEEKKNSCLVQNIAEPSHKQLPIIIRKIFLIIKQVGEQILEDIQQNSTTNYQRIIQSKTTVDNFTNFVRRTIISTTYGGREQSYFLWTFICKLSLVHHAYFYFYQEYSKNKRGNPQLIPIIDKVNCLFNDVYHSFYKKSYDNLDLIDKEKHNIYTTIFSLKKDDSLYYLFELTRNIQMASSFLFGYWLENKED